MKTSEEDDIWARGYYWEVPFLPVRVVIDKCDIFQSLPTLVVMGERGETRRNIDDELEIMNKDKREVRDKAEL